MPESKKRFLKSVALAVDNQMTIGMAQRPVSNTGAVPNDQRVVLCHINNMGKTKKTR